MCKGKCAITIKTAFRYNNYNLIIKIQIKDKLRKAISI